MRKRGKLASYIALSVAFVFCAALIAFAAQQPPDTVTIKAGLWPTPTKSPVTFSHKTHVTEDKIACTVCHHKYEDGKNVWKEGDEVQKCEKCHTEATIQGEKKLPPDQQKLNLKLAFHKQCIECHQKTKKEKPDTKAPVTCAQCHPGAKAE